MQSIGLSTSIEYNLVDEQNFGVYLYDSSWKYQLTFSITAIE